MNKLIKVMPDALIVAGAAALSYGAWLLHPAAGFITGGILMLAGGVIAGIGLSRSKAGE
jgi:hypothetical protein